MKMHVSMASNLVSAVCHILSMYTKFNKRSQSCFMFIF